MSYTLYISTIASGLAISLLGSLPLGNINLAAMHTAVLQGRKKAISFSVGAVIVEMCYLFITFQCIRWITTHQQLFLLLQWSAVAVLALLAIDSARRALNTASQTIKKQTTGNWLKGATISALNPLQFPYWAGWIVALTGSGWVGTDNSFALTFTFAAGVGTFAALLLFTLLGSVLKKWMQQNERLMHSGFAVLFAILCAVQLFSIVY